jgi:hypothetical protein
MNTALQAIDKPRRDLAAVSFEEKKEFMREYCDQHPLSLYLGGVIELFGSFPLMRDSAK